jgi:hypothetical protein
MVCSQYPSAGELLTHVSRDYHRPSGILVTLRFGFTPRPKRDPLGHFSGVAGNLASLNGLVGLQAIDELDDNRFYFSPKS